MVIIEVLILASLGLNLLQMLFVLPFDCVSSMRCLHKTECLRYICFGPLPNI